MRIIPVLDLMAGVVVRGVGGRRHEYRPIVSRLTASTQPVEVAQAFRESFGLTELYVADLDAIGGAVPSTGVFADLIQRGFRLWVDAGLRRAADGEALTGVGVVVGLETVAGPAVLEEVCRRLERDVLFSLDLRHGEPLGDVGRWTSADPEGIAAQAVSLGVQRLLVLDLAGVGEDQGCHTEALCRRLRSAHPNLELWTGGGVRDGRDLTRLEQIGIDAVLVASALHFGKISPEQVRLFLK